MTTKRRELTKIVDIRGFGVPEEVPIKFSQDVAPEDEFLGNSDLHIPVKYLNLGKCALSIPNSLNWNGKKLL